MPPVDFSVFTGAAQTPFGPDLKQVMQMQALQQRMQQLQQVQQGENALRSLYQNSANVDPDTGMLRPQARNRLMQLSPSAGQDYMAQAAQIEERQQRAKYLTGQAYEKEQSVAHEIGSGALAYYNERLPKDGPERALRQTNDWLGEQLDSARKSGSLSPQSLEKFQREFDPITFRSREAAYIAAHTKPLTQGQQVDIGFKRQDERRKDAAFRRGEFNKAQEIELPDGSKVMAQQSKDTGQWVTADEKKEPLPTPTRAVPAGKADTLHPSKEIAIVDKDGSVVERFAARESAGGPGWVRSDDGKPVVVPSGGKIDVGQASGAVIGSRENVYIGRILEGGITATTDLENISRMPVGVSSGMFGGRRQGPGLLDATREVLANKLTSQDVQIYNSANVGIQRALAIIESSGLAPSGAFTEQFQGLTLKEGDTQLARLYKMANARQIVENGMEVIKANPRVAPEQKKLADKFVQRVEQAIPWTTKDVIALQTSDQPDATLHNLGVGKTGKGETSQPATALPSEAVSKLKEGQVTTFGNGQRWTLRNGQPEQVR